MSEFATAVEKGIDNTFVKWADGFGKELQECKVTSSQIRNIFCSVKRLEMEGKYNMTTFLLLKPILSKVICGP